MAMTTARAQTKRQTVPQLNARKRTTKGNSAPARGLEPVQRIIQQWNREKPEVDTGPMALFGALARAYLLTSPQIERFMEGYGVSRGMFDVLAALRRSGKPYCLPPTTLSKWLMLSGAGMTNRLDRLEVIGLIARLPAPSDRRSIRIQLTAKGRQLVEKLIPRLVEMERDIVTHFGEANFKKLTELLMTFNESLAKEP